MYVRLAFAVAAHLEPEILVVDEVLAVGDAAFQKKCLGKMESVAREDGRTVLFVSHNMVAVKQLCQKGIWLSGGRVRLIGPINEVAQAYAVSVQKEARMEGFSSSLVKSDGRVELVAYRVTNAAGKTTPPPGTKEDVLIHVTLRVRKAVKQPACGVSIYNDGGVLMTCINTVEQGTVLSPMSEGELTVCVRLNRVAFLPGTYTASFWVMNPQGHIHVLTENSIVFEIAQVPLYGTCHVDHRWGCVYSDVRFSFEPVAKAVALAP
jgi:lipopolysaccharide transport system ATP-binding protein